MDEKIQINQKIRNNAIIAYLFIFVNILFLFSKNNSFLNSEFVKSHTKTAIMIHIWFLINTIIFAYYWLWFYGEIMGYTISDIIAIVVYLGLFVLMLLAMYKAYCGKFFILTQVMDYKNHKNLLDIDSSWSFDEKNKVTLIFSRIPILGFLILPSYKENKLIENNTKFNLIFTGTIIFLYVFWNNNLANFLLLIYIIFMVYSSINIFVRNEVINIKLDKFPFPREILNYLKVSFVYLYNYINSKKEFRDFESLFKNFSDAENKRSQVELKFLKSLENFKLNKYLVYIPLINFISLFNLNSKQKNHIINGFLISISFIVLALIYSFDNKYQLFLLIPLFFAIWNLKAWNLNYKIPFLYDIFLIFVKIKDFIFSLFFKLKKIKNTEKENKLKVKS